MKTLTTISNREFCFMVSGALSHCRQKLLSFSWLTAIAVATALFECNTVKADGISLRAAVYAVQSWSMDSDVVAITQLQGPKLTYNYVATNSVDSWTGLLTGGNVALSYTGDASAYARGLLTWNTTGTSGLTNYAETGLAQFTPIPGGAAFAFTNNLVFGSTTGMVTMTGLVTEDPAGKVYVDDFTTSGALILTPAPVPPPPIIWLDWDIADDTTWITANGWIVLVDTVVYGNEVPPNLCSIQAVSPVVTASIVPTNGLSFAQVNITFAGSEQPLSAYGLVRANIADMTASTGIPTGYLNVYNPLSSSWIIRNMPIEGSSGLPGISTMFDLGINPGTAVTDLYLQTLFSPVPLTEYRGSGPTNHFVLDSPINYDAQNGGASAPAQDNRADPSLISFRISTNSFLRWELGHNSVEQATNQCGPAAVANSLEWLRNTYSNRVPLDPALTNIPGVAGEPTNSLVGQLDNAMNRTNGWGLSDLGFLNGKLAFIADTNNGLKGALVIKHWPGTDTNVVGNQTNSGVVSIDVSTNGGTLIDWILAEIAAGEDVEMSWVWAGGTNRVEHCVNVN